MSTENVEVVRRAIEASAREDWPAMLAEFDPEIEIDDTDILDADEYRGHDAVFKWMARWNEGWESSRMEDVQLLPAGRDKVIAEFRMVVKGKGSGIELERDDALVCELRNGKVARIGYYNDQAKARAAAGLPE
jgi:ketosteroid isomerase-like protein